MNPGVGQGVGLAESDGQSRSTACSTRSARAVPRMPGSSHKPLMPAKLAAVFLNPKTPRLSAWPDEDEGASA